MRRRAAVLAAALLPLALAACSSGGGTSPTSSPSDSSSSMSPSDSATSTPTDTPTSTPTESPTASPSTVTPSPAVGIDGITVVYGPTSVTAGTKVSIVGTTVPTLVGKQVLLLKLNDGAPRILATGQSVNAKGEIKTYAQLQRTGVLQLVVPKVAVLLGAPDSAGTYPWNPDTALLAQSGQFTVTVTG